MLVDDACGVFKAVSHVIKSIYLSEINCIADGLLNFHGTFVTYSLFEAVIVAALMFSVALWRSKITGEVYLCLLSVHCQ